MPERTGPFKAKRGRHRRLFRFTVFREEVIVIKAEEGAESIAIIAEGVKARVG